MGKIKDIKQGDIYYFLINQNYYFMQVIHITAGLAKPYDTPAFNFGLFITVFEKKYKTLPQSVHELDLNKVYRIKTKPKKSLLYICDWLEQLQLKLEPDSDAFKLYSKIKIEYFGNYPVSTQFFPELNLQFTLPIEYKQNADGVCISAVPAKLSYIFDRIHDDENNQVKKRRAITPTYFPYWLDHVDIDIVIKMEKILTVFKLDCSTKDVNKALKRCIQSINKLDQKSPFISTIEAENICEKLSELGEDYGMTQQDVYALIEKNRDW